MAISDHFLRKVQINTHDFVLTSVIRDYLDEKIKKIENFVKKRFSEVLFEISVSRISHRRHGTRLLMVMNLKLNKEMVRSEEQGEDIYEIIDTVEYEILRQLKAEKDKFLAQQRKRSRKAKTEI
ncbi:MAG: ribosomal subunit interface protein [Candidatus Brennerbacteria bacterium RIFOXYC1_FULL_41_11]|uniref:Ribosomal subunit interface protein n=1 Tax=Candidatus Brennerbacteria bacterium RIFOXYD1_FULL_41_16 TaxID=1797529 RepID=A0A1G1XLK6_9BACT|nr:MAG: hypothetical protein UU61_C0016G0005 [Parcubacteria group bacterium GW2011_GWB1_41_4]OGY39153.1 MAG: ribosomal subunit interface protein [Candidatus Brennerbacteria bacterium RIFOXYB1_FULL_41_13]OGY39835.1 MAG: ribosomal subunit interface protein [Candidatus Brennerbacteria bacterium RIFOXYC1_FULL_41_11]OGY40566.1 MAG: ribosomal subunit interface protein [Candidatus Brennerbacteria bacterium RIFOXYD1_FULL_41_16]